jgi:4-hydroxybenzoyl-CoA thioesterase
MPAVQADALMPDNPRSPPITRTAMPTPSEPRHFEKQQLIRFHHCDPAGIVFYPEYLVIIDELIEDWFTEGMKTSFADLHAVERIGIPAARIEVDFISPSKIGDVLCLRLFVTRIGTKSFTLMVEASVGDKVRLRAILVRVVASLDGLQSIPIPESLRAKLQPYQISDVHTGREPTAT